MLYESGLAHALAKPAILLSNSIDDVPFDLRALRVIEYNKNYCDWGNVLKEKIEKSIKETLESPLNAVLPTFLKIDNSEKRKISISERDFLRLKRDFELMRNEIHHSSNLRGPSISQIEAINKIKRYIERDMSTEIIIHRIITYGISVSWIRSQIKKYRGQSLFEADVDENVSDFN